MTFQDHADQGQNHTRETDDRRVRRSLGSPANGQSTDQDREVEAQVTMAQVCSGFQLDVSYPNDFCGEAPDDPSVNSGNPMTMDCWFKMIKIVERRKFRVEDVEPLGL